MKVKFDFNLEAWIRNLEIEADSVEQAQAKLRGMSLEEMLEVGACVEYSDVENVDHEVMEATYIIKVTAVDYAVDEFDIEFDVMSDEEIEAEIARVKESLPQELELEIECEPDSLDDMVADAIAEETGWLIYDCEYEIVEVK